jgi:hypothetical protein
MGDRAAWTKYAGGEVLKAPRSKYGARVQEVDGVRFDSRKEARRYQELRILERAGLIRDLELHPRYAIVVRELKDVAQWITCGHYTADFRYLDVERRETVIEDVKSTVTRTTAYRLRKRLVEAIYGIRILEV